MEAAAKLVGDSDPQVRLQLACTLGEWNDPRAGESIGKIAIKDASDPLIAGAIELRKTYTIAQSPMRSPRPRAKKPGPSQSSCDLWHRAGGQRSPISRGIAGKNDTKKWRGLFAIGNWRRMLNGSTCSPSTAALTAPLQTQMTPCCASSGRQRICFAMPMSSFTSRRTGIGVWSVALELLGHRPMDYAADAELCRTFEASDSEHGSICLDRCHAPNGEREHFKLLLADGRITRRKFVGRSWTYCFPGRSGRWNF